MAIIDLYLHEIEITFAPKMVLFGSADETVEGPSGSVDSESTRATSGSYGDFEPSLPGIVLFVFGIVIAIWLGRQRIADRSES